MQGGKKTAANQTKVQAATIFDNGTHKAMYEVHTN